MNPSTIKIRNEATALYALKETTLFPQLTESRSKRHKRKYGKEFVIDVVESESSREISNRLYKIVQSLFYEPFTPVMNERLNMPVSYLTTSSEFKSLLPSEICKQHLSRQFMKKNLA